MNILLVNDDGYFAEGLTRLALALAKNHTVCVVAPDKCCSGMGHASTFCKPFSVKKIVGYPYDCYSICGTPSDSVLVGLYVLKDNPPDVIISGINEGLNLGTEIIYSGTVNAALEASIHNYKAIALSAQLKCDSDYQYAVDYFLSNFDYYLSITTKTSPISVNINTKNKSNKQKLCTMGERKYDDFFTVEEKDGYYLFTLDGLPVSPEPDPLSDVYNYQNGYTTITPLIVDFTNYQRLKQLERDTFEGGR